MHAARKLRIAAGCLAFALPASGQSGSDSIVFPPITASSIDTLAHRLVDGLTGDSAKARVLHDWVARNVRYDVGKGMALLRNPDALYESNDASQSAGRVFVSRLAVCEGYSNLLKTMCLSVGLEAAVVEGLGRPAGETPFLHGWNAVRVDGTWRLMDVTWAAGGVDMPKKTFTPRYDDAFFMPDPVSFLETHYPSDPAWQLVPNPVTRKQFDRSAFGDVADGTFQYGDTLAAMQAMDTLDALAASMERALAFDPGNRMVKASLESLYNFRQNERMNEANRLSDVAVSRHNTCMRIIQEARSKRSVRLMDENRDTLLSLAASCRADLTEALDRYRSIRFTDQANARILEANRKLMQENLKSLGELEDFLKQFYAAPPIRKKQMLQ